MISLYVGHKAYNVEFRHITKYGKNPQLRSRAPLKAVTTCVLVDHDFIAIDNALCSEMDNFCRQEGRLRSLRKLLRHCAALRDMAPQIWIHYLAHENIKLFDEQISKDPLFMPVLHLKPQKTKLSFTEIRAKITAGYEKRAMRQTRKAGAGF